MKIFWTDFAKNELHRIFNYHKEVASLKVARKLATDITLEVAKLQSHSMMGQREESLLKRIQEFRYLVHKNYKIIYWQNIKEERIEITDIFDTRQHPEKINRNR